MKNLKCGSRLALAFGVVILLIVLICFVGISRLRIQEQAGHDTVNLVYPKAAAAQTLSYLSVDMARVVRNLILVKDEKSIASNKTTLEKDLAQMGDNIKILEAGLRSDDERTLFKVLTEARVAYLGFTDDVVRLALAGNKEEAIGVLYGEKYKTQGAYLTALKNMVTYQEATMRHGSDILKENSQNGFMIMVALGAFATLVGFGSAWLITRSIVRPLQAAVDTATTVAAGDLTSRIEATSKDEFGHLQQALRAMNDNLYKIIGQTRSGVDMISTAASQMASGNQDLSLRTEQQASSLEETASSMEELTATVKRTTDNARQAKQLALAASEVATRGGDVVAQVVDTMDAINEASQKMADIIGVIDGIAFQTNILALNAAVEAARAGEQGRGFAVVATEVRNLAQRSAAAAKEIKSLIDDSVERVALGSQLVGTAGATMGEIVGSVKQVSDIMTDIAAATEEQSLGIEQVNQAIGQMDQVTQQNAALVEEGTAASAAMQDQAVALAQTVGMFKLDAAGAHTALQAPRRHDASAAAQRRLAA